MERRCDACQSVYDDAERSTICPHDRFLTPTLQAQKDLGLSLFGKSLRFHHEADTAPVRMIDSVGWDGLVTVRGLTGEFAPHLFKVVDV